MNLDLKLIDRKGMFQQLTSIFVDVTNKIYRWKKSRK